MDILIFGACFAIVAAASKQIGQQLVKTGLPLISGFLFTGIVAGPHVLDIISSQACVNLRFVDEFSLGYIAFAAGGELYLKELKNRVKTIAWMTICLVGTTFLLTSLTTFFLADWIPFMASMPMAARIGVSVLAGAIMVARSPSSAIAVVNELRARGAFTQTVLGVTIIMDVVVIVLFAANTSVADALFSGVDLRFGFVLLLVAEIGASIVMGYLVFQSLVAVMKLPVQKAVKAVFILTTGYLVFWLTFAFRRFVHDALGLDVLLEPLLTCMVAGFLVSNHSRFKNEFSKILLDVGPPIYIAFFTLTGASLSLDVLVSTWPIAVALFFARGIAIFAGSFMGGSFAKNPLKNNLVSGMAFITQAGVGLGLAKAVVVEFPGWGDAFATIMISVIILNQIIGPIAFKAAIKLMNEDRPKAMAEVFEDARDAIIFGTDGQAVALAMSLSAKGWQVKIMAPVTAVEDKNNTIDKNPDIQVVRLGGLTLAELERNNCHRVGAIVAMLTDEENYTICEIAYEHFGTQTIIARLGDRNNFHRFQRLDVLIVDPSTAIVNLLDHFVRSPAAASLFMGMDTDRKIMDVVLRNPDLFGLALRDLRLPFDTVIMSVRRRGVLFIPHDYTRLEAGDLVTLVGSVTSLAEVVLRFDVNRKEALVQMVEKAAATELTQNPVKAEVKEIIARKPSAQKDRFDRVVEQSTVLDIKEPMDQEAFFQAVARAMAPSLNVSAQSLKQMLIKREEQVTTVLAPGLAVPHIIIEGREKFSILLARSRRGIEFVKSQPLVHAAFVLVGSKDQRNFHLRALSAIAQIVMDPRFERKWMRAKTTSGLRKVIMYANRKRGKEDA
ncbi:TrkA3 [Desulforapulum autotrophicum HRM2]|uniref:TrkA3 n=1 Tax=Desulforapulum autotrophicum (strain ATCC 43914 / DSM 3382 / VKM B-1955 / HRM2) TaxID=177437 RepID=C0QEP3_DESAH|nr:cation:proton antiporter [Desulforapulum autotrophicum]ACN15385.1 TrkA3 [Desulforapulum autotrophicum HRM2]